MSDIVTLSEVAGAALPATFTFLYQRLGHLLDSRGQAPEPEPEVPAELVGELALPLQVDEERVQQHLGELQLLRNTLSLYARGAAPLAADDEVLLNTLGQLRSRLEELYGQHLTFAGEQRPPSGSRYVRQKVETLAGEATGIEAQERISGDAQVVQDIGTVERGGKLVGMRAPRIGDSQPRRA